MFDICFSVITKELLAVWLPFLRLIDWGIATMGKINWVGLILPFQLGHWHFGNSVCGWQVVW
ncbi:Uncharacterised protein [Mycobacteroides abscessus subsp. abscessus]|nr:Uncharacterised protein [Mycobacteroides abscessus subsp. abscessus]